MTKDRAENILELIGSTPLVKLNRIVEDSMADYLCKTGILQSRRKY